MYPFIPNNVQKTVDLAWGFGYTDIIEEHRT